MNNDDIDFQLGEVIRQKGKPIAFYGRKITDTQKSYTVTEKERLRIVETIKEFITILLGQISRIYLDHKTLTCNFLNNDRVLRQRLILEEYGRDIEYTQVEKNLVTNALSIFTINGNQETRQDPTYEKELVS